MPDSFFNNNGHSLIVVTDYNPLTRSSYIARLEWGGPVSSPVLISWLDWHNYQALIRSYWAIDVYQGEALNAGQILLVRKDRGYHYCYYRFLHDWFWWLDRVRGFHRNIILTAMVWGLAWVPGGEIPSNRHLFKKHPQ